LPDRTLLIIASDRPSAWIAKGEVVDRYYNPLNTFTHVHLLCLNDDMPDRDAVQRMAGNAEVTMHNIDPGRGFFTRTLGWQPRLLRRWARSAVALARRIRPAVVRCHGADLNAYVAHEINRALGIPYVVSLHINPDADSRSRGGSIRERFRDRAIRRVESLGLLDAAAVLPVYEAIVPYLRGLGITRYEVAYNMINPSVLVPKERYELADPVRVVCVGRQFAAKCPTSLICAVARLDAVHLTLIGDGPAHDHLVAVARENLPQSRVSFRRSVPNDVLCGELPGFDIFAVHSEYWEISKAVLEAMLTGLPVIINERKGEPVPELTSDTCVLVEDTPNAYERGLRQLIEDDRFREALGRRARSHAQEHWAPKRTEARLAQIYRRVVGA
jgi:glycosyltransferase involved in cell wall biosynthesis